VTGSSLPKVTINVEDSTCSLQGSSTGTYSCRMGRKWDFYHYEVGKTLGKLFQLFGCHILSSEKVSLDSSGKEITVYMKTDVRDRFRRAFEGAHPKPCGVGSSGSQPIQGNTSSPTHPNVLEGPSSSSSSVAKAADKPLSASDIEGLLGGTSDHSWKTYEVQSASDVSGTPSICLKVGTWNLMDRCSSSVANGAGNNPLKVDEDATAYQKRKHEQILEIERIIQTTGINACMFQELDFVRSGMFVESLPGPLTEESTMFLNVYREFKTMLDRNGWRMITTVVPPKKTQDFLGIIYNPRTVSPDPRSLTDGYLTGCFSQDEQFRGATAVFTDLHSQRPIALTDLHLKFGKDPQAQIEDHQKARIRLGIPEIALGDLNQTPNKEGLASAIIDWTSPTNVDASPVKERGNPNALTTKDGDLNKAYDAALCSPGGPMESMIVTETEMMRFVPNPGVGQGFKLERINLRIQHHTRKGRPYMRRRVLVVKIQQELEEATLEADRVRLKNELIEIQSEIEQELQAATTKKDRGRLAGELKKLQLVTDVKSATLLIKRFQSVRP
jgi:hypothetical protein